MYNHIACGTLLTSILPGRGGLGNVDLSWTQVYPHGGVPVDFSRLYEYDDYRPSCAIVNICVEASHAYLLKHPQPEMLGAIGDAEVEPEPGLNLNVLPDGFAGQWTGEGTQTAPDLSWPIAIDLTGGNTGDIVGTVDYPADPCRGELTLMSIESDTEVTVVYVADSGGTAYALDVEDGDQAWQFPTEGGIYAGVAVARDTVVFESDDGNLYGVNATDGFEEWRFPAGGGFDNVPSIAGGIVYAGDPNGSLLALDIASGTERCRFRTATGERFREPVVTGGMVFTDGNL